MSIHILGGIEEEPPGRYWRKHTAVHSGWYYRSADTPVEATRLILESVAPNRYAMPWLTNTLTNSIGPHDWPETAG